MFFTKKICILFGGIKVKLYLCNEIKKKAVMNEKEIEAKAKEIAGRFKMTYDVYDKCGGTTEEDSFDECYESAKCAIEWVLNEMKKK